MKELLPGIEIKAIITIGVSIMITLEDKDKNTGSFLHEWDGNNSYDFWDSITFKGEKYDIHIDNDTEWQVAIYGLQKTVFVKDGKEVETFGIDMSQSVGIYESTNEDSFTIIEQCHISKKPVVFESNGDGTREYDVCCECEEHTHPDEMVTLPEEDERMEVCSKCHSKESGSIEEVEEMDNLVNTVIEKIKEDIKDGDLTAIDELLRFVPKENLIGYLPE